MCRPLALTMPRVTLWLRPKGLPMASTKSPISSASLSPSRAGDQVRRADGQHGDVGFLVFPNAFGMEDAAIGEVDSDELLRRMADDVAVGEHVVLAAQFDDHAGAGFFDVEQAAILGQQRGFDVDDGGRDELDDALDEAELAVERVDVAGEGGVFAVAVARRGGARR